WLIAIVIAVLGTVFDQWNGQVHSAPLTGTLPGLAALTVGALIVSRRPANRIGWLLLLVSFVLGFGGAGNFAEQYTLYALLTQPGSLPAAEWMLWTGKIAQVVGFFPLVTFLL